MADESLVNLSLETFLDRLGSDAPTPGGGAVAALTGALAAALGRMACGLTSGKPGFENVRAQIDSLASGCERSGRLLRTLIQEDAAAYEELSAAFKLDRSEPTRPARIAQSADLAASVPLQTLAIARRMLDDLERLEPICNPNLRPDVRSAMHLARSAALSACENVRANLPLLERQRRAALETELDRLSSHLATS